MDDELLKQDVGATLAGNDNELLDPVELDDTDDLDDGLVDQELEKELDDPDPEAAPLITEDTADNTSENLEPDNDKNRKEAPNE